MRDDDNEQQTGIKAHADESAPLLAHAEPSRVTESVPELARTESDQATTANPDEDAPLPKLQILLLCYARIVEPIAFFSIFPFVPQMIFEVGHVPTANVGFWAGLIESLFSVTQMCLMIFWGRVADRFGRRPVLIFSLWGVAAATALFGFSRSLWQMVVFRCVAGVFAGTVVTIRTMISENSTKKTQARAFSWFAFSSNIGITVGPLIGGALAKPVETWPGVFGHVQLFKDYPYALPTIVTGSLGASAALIVTLFVKETLKPVEQGEEHRKSLSMWEILKADGVAPVLFLYGYVMQMGLSFTSVIPVFWFTPVKLGGYGFPPRLISIFLAVAGLAQVFWLLVAYPPLSKRIGTGGVLRLWTSAWPVFYAGASLGNLLLRYHQKALFWTVAPLNQICGSGVIMVFTASQLALNAVSPGQREFGTLNAMALALGSGIRTITPVLFTSLYAAGVRTGWVGGQLIFIVLIAQALGLIVAMRWLPERAAAEGKMGPPSDVDADVD